MATGLLSETSDQGPVKPEGSGLSLEHVEYPVVITCTCVTALRLALIVCPQGAQLSVPAPWRARCALGRLAPSRRAFPSRGRGVGPVPWLLGGSPPTC